MSQERNCHTCGMPSGAISSEGVRQTLRIKPKGWQKRNRSLTVWCCSESCAIQDRAVAAMGPATHKWHLSLTEFAALEQVGSNRPETHSQVVDSKEAKSGNRGVLDLPHTGPVSARVSGRGGRPRKWESDAQRKRAYRERKLKRRAAAGQGEAA